MGESIQLEPHEQPTDVSIYSMRLSDTSCHLTKTPSRDYRAEGNEIMQASLEEALDVARKPKYKILEESMLGEKLGMQPAKGKMKMIGTMCCGADPYYKS